MSETNESASKTNPNEDAYSRRLGLAILGVLREKGVLSEKDVNTVLLAVNHSMRQSARRATKGTGQAKAKPVPEIDIKL